MLHRRAGKTTCVVNHHQRAALDDGWETQRLRFLMPSLTDTDIRPLLRGRHYGHVMPTYRQAKNVTWAMLKHYAIGTGAVPNESELLLKYPNGSIFQLFGADNPDSLRGMPFSGLSFDEFSQQPRTIFSEVLSKALADHLGYAIFCGTIKGRDHLYETHKAAKGNPAWFSVWQDIDESLRTESGVTIRLLEQAMSDDQALIAQGLMTQDEYDQEWYLSADAAIKGAFFLKELAAAKKSDRITTVPCDPALPVDTTWDLGIGDAMAIWFTQSAYSGQVRVIDYYENSGEGLPHYREVLNRKGYTYGEHWAPHDIEVKELGVGRSRKETAYNLGLNFQVVPKLSFDDGIHAARLLFPKCWFDETKTQRGVDCLRHYRKAFNQSLSEYKDVAVHDWASHAADAFRYLAVRHQTPRQKAARREQPEPLDYYDQHQRLNRPRARGLSRGGY